MQKSATIKRTSAEPTRTEPVESLSILGQIEQVVSSADCRSAETVSSPTTRVSEQKSAAQTGGGQLPEGESADPPRQVLVVGFGGSVHKSTCYAIRGRRFYRVVAPDIAATEIPAFLAARKFDYVCGACLKDGGRFVPRRAESKANVRCAICERGFLRNNSRSRYCSDACSLEGERRTEREFNRAYKSTHPDDPEKKRARKAVYVEVRAGRLIRPELCSACRCQGNIQAHHHRGYEEPHWLDVTWLCVSCHEAVHHEVPA